MGMMHGTDGEEIKFGLKHLGDSIRSAAWVIAIAAIICTLIVMYP